MDVKHVRIIGLFATSAATALGYAALARSVRKGKTRQADKEARIEVLDHTTERAKKIADVTGWLGNWRGHLPAALATAGAFAYKRRALPAVVVASSSLAGAAAARILDRVHQHRSPPPGRGEDKQCFPSGHSLEPTVVAVVSSWVVVREQVAPKALAAPLAVATSLVAGLGRLLLDRHWTTDSIAGYLAGISLGTALAGGYELVRAAD